MRQNPNDQSHQVKQEVQQGSYVPVSSQLDWKRVIVFVCYPSMM
jgi:hypothetical protein